MDDDVIYTGGGHPQGVPYEMDEGAHDVRSTRGEGTHKGCAYEMDDDVIYTGGGRPQGAPLRDG